MGAAENGQVTEADEQTARRDTRPIWTLIVGIVLTAAFAWMVGSVSEPGAPALVVLLGLAGSFGAAFAVKWLAPSRRAPRA